MSECEVCHNEYAKSFTVNYRGQTHTFDSFECAIHALAPRCDFCGIRILGHGVEASDRMFCSAHCARSEGYQSANDNVVAESQTM